MGGDGVNGVDNVMVIVITIIIIIAIIIIIIVNIIIIVIIIRCVHVHQASILSTWSWNFPCICKHSNIW